MEKVKSKEHVGLGWVLDAVYLPFFMCLLKEVNRCKYNKQINK